MQNVCGINSIFLCLILRESVVYNERIAALWLSASICLQNAKQKFDHYAIIETERSKLISDRYYVKQRRLGVKLGGFLLIWGNAQK